MSLIMYGDSMVSGFATTRDIPDTCVADHTVISDDKLTSLSEAVCELAPGSQAFARPGFQSDQVAEFFRATPQWRDNPTLFWFGRCEKPVSGRNVVAALKGMTAQLTGPWWVCAIPTSQKEVEQSRTAPVDEANALISDFAGERFLDPIRALCGAPVLSLAWRLDKFHPTSAANRALACWIVNRTIGSL